MSGARREAAGERRLFFALWPTPELRASTLAATAGSLAEAGGRAVPAENLHVTLAFLGATPAERLDAVLACGRGLAAARGTVTFDRLVAWGRAGPLVLEPTAPAPALAALHGALRNRLVAAGFQLESRDFQPHITLARKLSRRPAAASIPPLAWPFDGFVLVDSEAGPTGSRYTVLARFPG